MNDTQPSPAFPPMLADWVEKDRELRRLAEEVLPLNKTALFDALAAAGIEIVTVVFDGCGDSGQIEDIEAKAGDLVVALPADQIEIACPVWGGSEIERRTQSVRDSIEALAYDFLGQTHGGWENNDGACGDFTFDVAERTITLDYNERHMETDNSQHVF